MIRFLLQRARVNGTPGIERLFLYWRSGGWSIITETQQQYIAFFYKILTECLIAATTGSYFGSLLHRKYWDIFKLCKVISTAFFFLPEYRDSRSITLRQHIALLIASFLLAFGRVPKTPRFRDTYALSLHLLPAFGLHLLGKYKMDTYEKWRFNVSAWCVIVVSFYMGCPIFVSVLKLVSVYQYTKDCLRVAVLYVVHLEVVIMLFIMGWNHICWKIVVQLFFQTGGRKIFFWVFFGYLLPWLMDFLIHDAAIIDLMDAGVPMDMVIHLTLAAIVTT